MSEISKLFLIATTGIVLITFIGIGTYTINTKYECEKQKAMAEAGLVQQPTVLGPMWIPKEYYQNKIMTID